MLIETILRENKIIAASTHHELEEAITSNASAVVLMEANLNELIKPDFLELSKKKPIFIHMDLVRGLSNDREAVRFVANNLSVAGIVSTKSTTIKAAKKHGLLAIQRTFLIDSKSLVKTIESVKENNPDVIEIMPAVVNTNIRFIKEETNKPIILGCLIKNEDEIKAILASDVEGVSFSEKTLWNL